MVNYSACEDMEEAIQDFVRQKIQEVLVHCGLSDSSDERFNEEIVHISRSRLSRGFTIEANQTTHAQVNPCLLLKRAS